MRKEQQGRGSAANWGVFLLDGCPAAVVSGRDRREGDHIPRAPLAPKELEVLRPQAIDARALVAVVVDVLHASGSGVDSAFCHDSLLVV